MSITIRLPGPPPIELELTRAIVAAVAHELWRALPESNAALNWLEAERFVLKRLAGAGPGRGAGPIAPSGEVQPKTGVVREGPRPTEPRPESPREREAGRERPGPRERAAARERVMVDSAKPRRGEPFGLEWPAAIGRSEQA